MFVFGIMVWYVKRAKQSKDITENVQHILQAPKAVPRPSLYYELLFRLEKDTSETEQPPPPPPPMEGNVEDY